MPVKKNAKVSKKPALSVAKKLALPKKTSTEVKKTTEVRASLSVDVFDTKGEKSGTVTLAKELFGAKVNEYLLAQAIRVYLANQRQGTVSTKTRGEVAGSTRKIYRQKGTGRARHGSIRAPIFVKGGIVFGPKPRDFRLDFSKKMKRVALASALSLKHKQKQIKVLKGLEEIEPKTKIVAGVFKNLGLDGKNRKVLLVLPSSINTVLRSTRNIEGIRITLANTLNPYQVLDTNEIIFMDSSLAIVEKTFIKAD